MHINFMETEEIMNKQSLEQTLINQIENPHKNYYVMCLSLSRQQPPNQKIINLVNLLLEKDIATGQQERWLEVLRRLALHNYELVFHLCSKNFYAIRAVLSQAAVYGNNQDLDNLLSVVYSISKQFSLKVQESGINLKDLQILLASLTTIMETWINRDDVIMYRFLQQFSQLPQLLKILSNQIDRTIKNSIKNFIREQNTFNIIFWHFHENLIKTFAKFEKIANKNFQMNHFLSNFDIIVQYLKYVIEKILDHLHRILVQNQFLEEHRENIIEIMKCIANYLTFKDISFSIIFFRKKQILAELFANVSLTRRFQQKADLQDVMHGQYDLIIDQMADDLVGCLGLCLNRIIEIDGFFLQFLISLQKFKQKKMKLLNEATPIEKKQILFTISQILLKICIAKNKCIERVDLSQNFLRQLHQETADLLTIIIPSQPKKILVQIAICRHLRYISFLHKLLKDDQFIKCIDTCLIILLNKNPQSILFKESYQIISSMIQSQPTDILKNNILDIADKFISNFSQVNTIDQKVYRLLNLLLDKYSKITQKMYEKILYFLKNSFEKQLTNIWNRGMKTSPSLLCMLNCIKATLKQIKDSNLLDQDEEYLSIDSALQTILYLLQQPYKIQFQDQIISILCYMLRISNTITDTLCRACIFLKNIVTKDNSLVNITQVIQIISQSPMIRKQILFNYPDLISYFLQIIENFFYSKIGKEKQEMAIEQVIENKQLKIFKQYLQLYPEQWRNTIEVIMIFIQSYEDWFEDQSMTKVQIFYSLYNYSIKLYQEIHMMLNSCDINSSTNRILKFCIEPIIQLLLTLNHISFNQSNIDKNKLYLHGHTNWDTLVNFIEKCLVHNNYTIKLVVMNYCDQLIYSYEEKLLDSMMNFFIKHRRCQIGKQCRRDGDWVHFNQKTLQANFQDREQAPGFLKKSKSHSECPYYSGLSTKDLISHTLRTLKSKRNIDDVQLNQNMQFCK